MGMMGIWARPMHDSHWCSLTRDRVLRSKSKRLRPMQRIGGSERRHVPFRAGRLQAHASQ